MNSFLNPTILLLHQLWRNFTQDDYKFRLATRQSRTSGWTWKNLLHRVSHTTKQRRCQLSSVLAVSHPRRNRRVSDRMPVIIAKEDQWLDPGVTDPANVAHLMKPF